MRRSTIGHVARSSDRGDSNKGKLMNVGRGGALTALVLLVAIGCGGSDAASSPDQGGGGGGNGTVVVTLPDGGTAEVPAPPPPPPPGEAVKGVFVSASKGSEGADGSKNRPVRTIGEGIKLGAQNKALPVIVCAETFNEAVKLVDGVTLYGNYDCSNLDDWKPVAQRAKIVSPTSPAVLAENVMLPAVFSGFDVQGPDIVAPGVAGTPAISSFGMMIKGSANLTVSKATLRGGRGQDGVDGAEAQPNAQLSSKIDGTSSVGQSPCSGGGCTLQKSTGGRLGGTSQCKVGANGGPGGKGGDGIFVAFGEPQRQLSNDDANGKPLAGTPEANMTAVGGVRADDNPNAKGGNGGSGAVGQLGAHGAWSFDGNGFVPGAGLAGTNGQPGKGGGGGGGGKSWFNLSYQPIAPPTSGAYYGISGASGGAGGCGGIAGEPGTGGGASIGLFVVSSTSIKVADARIESAKGGRAGRGADGTAGTPGGFGGNGRHAGVGVDSRPEGTPYGLAGGNGGAGGRAGMSGHGAPGPSIALVFSGNRPEIDSNTTEIVAGPAGDGHAATTYGSQTRPALDGISKPEHSF